MTSSLTALSRTARNVFLVAPDQCTTDALRLACAVQGIVNVRPVCNVTGLNLEPQSVDMLAIIHKKGLDTYANQATGEILRLLSDRAVIYVETKSWSDWRRARRCLRSLAPLKTVLPAYWITPLSGELRTAFPMANVRSAAYLFRHILTGSSWRKHLISGTGQALAALRILRYVMWHRATVVYRSPRLIAEVPEYIRSIAEQQGVNLDHSQIALSARGQYDSNKTILFLFPRGEGRPNVVVKVTRSPEFNFRLENEYRVLGLLRAQHIVESDSVPKPVFFGTAERLAVLGEEAIEGTPYRERTTASLDCPIFKRAAHWLLQLAQPSTGIARPTFENLVRQKITGWYEDFVRLYTLSNGERQFLEKNINKLCAVRGALPPVFQHGDPGTWNIWVTSQQHVVFMDWESGDPSGVPLWDLFYFIRSHVMWMCRKRGNKNSLENFSSQFLRRSEVTDYLWNTVDRYCAVVGIDPELAEPLFHACWMHRALKEAARMPSNMLQDGQYFNLLRLCISRQSDLHELAHERHPSLVA